MQEVDVAQKIENDDYNRFSFDNDICIDRDWNRFIDWFNYWF